MSNDPCLTCPLPLLPDGDCQESSPNCKLHAEERISAAATFVIKDSRGQRIRAEAAVREAMRGTGL